MFRSSYINCLKNFGSRVRSSLSYINCLKNFGSRNRSSLSYITCLINKTQISYSATKKIKVFMYIRNDIL
jgi:hypothetical protein